MYSLEYDLLADFEPVSLIADAIYLIVARKTAPANDLKGFIAWLKANPDKTTDATPGAGSVQHTLFLILMHNAHAQQLTVDPESIIPLSDKFDMEIPAPDVPPEITRFLGAWIGTWHDDRHILVVERVNPDGHATWFSRNRTRLSTTRIENGGGTKQSPPAGC
jgi:hypothetical protein